MHKNNKEVFFIFESFFDNLIPTILYYFLKNTVLKFIILSVAILLIKIDVVAQKVADTTHIIKNIKIIEDSITSNPTFAKTLAEENLIASKDIDYNWGIFNSHLSLGSIAYNEGAFEEAVKLHEEALKMVRKHGYKNRESLVISNLAKDYNAIGETEKAIKLYHEGIEVAESIKDDMQKAYC